MRKSKICILTFSDGREFVHEQLKPLDQKLLDKAVAALQQMGEVEVIPAR